MSAPPAARLTDTVSHTDSGFGFGLGGAIGLGVGLALLTVATGGADLAVLAAVGGAVALTGGGALMGMRIGATYGHVVGDITTGSPNVSVNALLAARTLADVALCSDHDGPQQIATGSTSVFINRMPAARLGDHTVCDARISSASGNVFIGGGTGTYAAISAEVSPVLVDVARDMAIGGTAVALGAGAGAAFAAAGWAGVGVFGLQAAGGLAGGIAGGLAGGAIGGAIDPVHGQAWGEAIGGAGGGVLGGVGAGGLAGGSSGAEAAAGSTPSDMARGWQGSDNYPGVDDWTDTTLPKGSYVVGATPGQSQFYTTLDGYNGMDGSAESYYQNLQVGPNTSNPDYPPYRSGATIYQVNTDNVPAASSNATANPQFGPGGAPQLFIPDYGNSLTPVQTIPFK